MPETLVFRTKRRVEFADTDMAGIMHFARFFAYMEQVEHEFLRSHGFSVIMTWEGRLLGFPRVSAHCDYQMPVRFEDVIDATLRIEKIGNKSITYQIDFSKDGQSVASGTLVVCCCTMDAQKNLNAIAIPESIKTKLLGG